MNTSAKKTGLSAIGLAMLWLALAALPVYAAKRGDLGSGGNTMQCFSQVSSGDCQCQAFANISEVWFKTDYHGDIILTANYWYSEQETDPDFCNATAGFHLYVPGQSSKDAEKGSSGSGTLTSNVIHVPSGSITLSIIVSCAAWGDCGDAQDSKTTDVKISRPVATTTTTIDNMDTYYPNTPGGVQGTYVSGYVENDETNQPASGSVVITVTPPLGIPTVSSSITLTNG